MSKPVIYTIGHSTHTLDYFLELLSTYSIDTLIDVRSLPASSYNPQFNKEPLSHFLKRNKINYLHMPEAFGARHTDPDVVDEEGKVNFDAIRKTWSFKNGIEQVIIAIENGKTIALMCSESDPLACHRFSMISVELEKQGVEVRHILKDKTSCLNTELEQQILKKYSKKIPHPDLFQPDITTKDQLRAAYKLHNKEVAYSPANPQDNQESDD